MSATATAGKIAKKMLIAANWKSHGTTSVITSLVNDVLNKTTYNPAKTG